MVLDNASASSSSDAFADSAPSDDADPYSDSEPGAMMNYHIDASNFPKPIPVFGRMFGYKEDSYRPILAERLKSAVPILGRNPSQEEATAFAYYAAKFVSVHSYGPPIGLAGGLWRAYDSRATFRFPLWQPNLEKFQPDVFPGQRITLLRGFNAIAFWHLTRTSAYAAVGLILSSVFFTTYAATVSAVGSMQDPRLKEFTTALRKESRKRQGSLPEMKRTPMEERQVPDGGRPAGSHYDRRDGSVQDDASPTGGMFDEENIAGSSGGFGESLDGNTQMGGTRLPPARPAPVQTRQEPQPFDAWDDASPVGGQSMGGSTAPTAQGSAWDRLRRGEKPNSQTSGAKQQPNPSPWMRQQNETQKERREGSTMGDSFAFSKTEEERSYAKEEAQREFDARVERERRGGDFSKGGGDQKRW